jgi:ADP-ribosylglycohydrolase
MNKIEASLMLASYFETVGFNNTNWEFNYNLEIDTFNKFLYINNKILNEYIILGGSHNINIKSWNSSDDTILLLATCKACILGGGIDNYKKQYIKVYKELDNQIRASGITTLNSIKLLKKNKNIPIQSYMGGNGAAMRTSPIGLLFYNNIDKVINESIIASKLTHNYYLGFLGGMITALFTAFAMKNIPINLWIIELLKYTDIIKKYYPKEHDIKDLNKFLNYWKKYQEIRVNDFNINSKSVIDIEYRFKFLSQFYPKTNNNNLWNNFTKSGLDCLIYSYDCLLITSDWDTFMTLVSIHAGDNDTTACIGGSWYGAFYGYNGFDKKRLNQLEYYNKIKELTRMILIH